MTDAPPPLPPPRPHERFVGALARLDRGQLAALRRSLGDDRPGQSVPWLEGVFIRSGLNVQHGAQREALALVAGLYALAERPHEDEGDAALPEPTADAQSPSAQPPSFGALFGRLYLAQGQRPSTEKRFLALLDADRDGLPYALRQAVTLLRAGGFLPDWVGLLNDVNLWTHPERGDDVRRRWARDFYRTAERVVETAEDAPNLDDGPAPAAPFETTGDEL